MPEHLVYCAILFANPVYHWLRASPCSSFDWLLYGQKRWVTSEREKRPRGGRGEISWVHRPDQGGLCLHYGQSESLVELQFGWGWCFFRPRPPKKHKLHVFVSRKKVQYATAQHSTVRGSKAQQCKTQHNTALLVFNETHGFTIIITTVQYFPPSVPCSQSRSLVSGKAHGKASG